MVRNGFNVSLRAPVDLVVETETGILRFAQNANFN